MIFMVPGFDDLRGLPDPLGFSSGLLILVVFRRYLFNWVPFGLLLSRMALRQLFQRLFDASPDSDIPKNVPFT